MALAARMGINRRTVKRLIEADVPPDTRELGQGRSWTSSSR
ncbi:hypothetical protein OJ998_00860 [Solirubrobacter taibaiensis]|nr:hypothetical protein [Solirubrobacter taibaiensis]